MAAGLTFGAGLVAGDGEAIVHAELDSPANDVGFAEFDERCVDMEAGTFGAGFGGQVGQVFKGGDIFRAAVRVAGIIDGVNAQKDVTAIQGFGQRQGQREHDGVACRYVGGWNAGLAVRFGDVDGEVCERRAAKLVHVDMYDPMGFGAECFGLL